MSATSPDDVPAPRLLDALRQQIRYLHYSRRTEEAYVHWVRAFVRFHGLRHPAELSSREVESFLAWLAAERSFRPSHFGHGTRCRRHSCHVHFARPFHRPLRP